MAKSKKKPSDPPEKHVFDPACECPDCLPKRGMTFNYVSGYIGDSPPPGYVPISTQGDDPQQVYQEHLRRLELVKLGVAKGHAEGQQELLDRAAAIQQAGKTVAPPSLLEQALAVLTPQQGAIMKHLWEKGTATFAALTLIPGAFQDQGVNPSDDAIEKKVKDIRKRLDTANLMVGDITISTAKKRVTLQRPAD